MGRRDDRITQTFRVDPNQFGDYETIKEACDFVRLNTTRDIFNPVVIEVRNGVYTEDPFIVPSFTTVRGQSENFAASGCFVYRGLGGTVPSSETSFITLETTATLENLSIATGWAVPANFDTSYSLILSSGGAADARDCFFSISQAYTGGNPCYIWNQAANAAPTLQNCTFLGTGSGLTMINAIRQVGLYYNMFIGDGVKEVLRLTHNDANQSTKVVYCRFMDIYNDPMPLTYINAVNVNTVVELYSCHVPLDKRSGNGTVLDWNPTPQQLETAARATTRTVAIDTTIDGYTDGTINRTAGNVTMPPLSETIDGQIFIISNSGATSMTIDGNGVNIDGGVTIPLNAGFNAIIQRVDILWKLLSITSGSGASGGGAVAISWTFTTPAGSTGVFYVGGFYDMFSGNDDFSPAATHGAANNPYNAHFFIVLGAVPIDTVTIRVTGTSITNGGVRVASDTEDIVLTTGNSIDDYIETAKHWLGQVSVSLVSGTAVNCNYGYSKYWDKGNSGFTITGWEATWTAGANDAAADIIVRHHKSTGWTYNAGAEPTPPPVIASMAGDYVTERSLVNGEPGAWKRTGLSELISGTLDEGFILQIETGSSKAFEIGNFTLAITSA